MAVDRLLVRLGVTGPLSISELCALAGVPLVIRPGAVTLDGALYAPDMRAAEHEGAPAVLRHLARLEGAVADAGSMRRALAYLQLGGTMRGMPAVI